MIYENIVRLCKERDIRIAKLEQECDLGNGTIGGWKNGKPRVDLLKRVADFFGVTIDELLKEEGEETD